VPCSTQLGTGCHFGVQSNNPWCKHGPGGRVGVVHGGGGAGLSPLLALTPDPLTLGHTSPHLQAAP